MVQTSLEEAKTLQKQVNTLDSTIKEAQHLRSQLVLKMQAICPHPPAGKRNASNKKAFQCCKVCGKLLPFTGR